MLIYAASSACFFTSRVKYGETYSSTPRASSRVKYGEIYYYWVGAALRAWDVCGARIVVFWHVGGEREAAGGGGVQAVLGEAIVASFRGVRVSLKRGDENESLAALISAAKRFGVVP